MHAVRSLLLCALAVVAAPVPSAAATPSAITWSVSVDPNCGGRGAHFAREVELACDALGHSCRVVASGAERRAVLSCARADQWTLEARSESGLRLWAVALEERRESRLRVAAMWLARAERDAPPPNAPVIAIAPAPPRPAPVASASAPQPAAAAPPPAKSEPPRPAAVRDAEPTPPKTEPTRATVAKSAEPKAAREPAVAPVAATAATEQPAATTEKLPDRATPAPVSNGRRGGLALSARGSLAGGLAPQTVGATARAAFGLPLRTTLGAVVSGEQAVGTSAGYGLTMGRLGGAIGWGAPWSADDTFGASLDAGVALGDLQAPSTVAPSSKSFLDPYAQLSIFGRWRATSAIRPWVALSVLALAQPVVIAEGPRDVGSLAQVSGALDVGIAWAAW